MWWTVAGSVTVAGIAYLWFKRPSTGPSSMTESNTSWDPKYLFPHSSIEQIHPRMWRVRGQLSYPLPRYMDIYALTDPSLGKPSLLLYSVVALSPEGMDALDEIGKPTVMIVPNCYHRLDAARYVARYPGMKVLCPAKVKEATEKLVRVDAVVEDVMSAYVPGEVGEGQRTYSASLSDIRYINIRGIDIGELVYRVDLGNGEYGLIFGDLVFNLPHPGKNPIGWLLGHGRFGPTNLIMCWRKNKPDFSRFFAELAAECNSSASRLTVLTMCHGDAILVAKGGDPTAKLGEVAKRFAK